MPEAGLVKCQTSKCCKMSDEQTLLQHLRHVFQSAGLSFSDDAAVNGPDGFNGGDAEDLIADAYRCVGLDAVESHRFPYDDYFLPESTFIVSPWRFLTRLAAFALDPFGIARRLRRAGEPSTTGPSSSRPTLKASDFVSIILRIKREVAEESNGRPLG
jgi:hypothetical protein